MRRYQGEALPDQPKISLIVNDSLGNFVAGVALAQCFVSHYQGASVTLWCGKRVIEFDGSIPGVAHFIPFLGSSMREMLAVASDYEADLVVNMERDSWAKTLATVVAGPGGSVVGSALAEDARGELTLASGDRGELWVDQNWIAEDLLDKYPGLMGRHIVDVFAYLCHLPGGLRSYLLPQSPAKIPVPDLVISTAASLPEKLWPTSHWIEFVHVMHARGLSVGLVGAKPSDQAKFWQGADEETTLLAQTGIQDLRGVLSLPQVVWLLSKAKLVFTLDNGILHLACATETPTVGLFRPGISRLWAPPFPNLQVLEPQGGAKVSDLSVSQAILAVDKFQRSLSLF
ncbi:MAG: hypothetical protein MUC92_06590 [Fimbriimonadaceae bacterium]|jgi:ADP-heptose:LPS heptosyltransferase|nr:hypothetical protein [Fimbriimonadaceae bacterium]